MERFWWMTATVVRTHDPAAQYTVSGVSFAEEVNEVWAQAIKEVEKVHTAADKRNHTFRIIVDEFGIMQNREH